MMKKLLMATAILALGATAFGVDKTATSDVRVRAELVNEGLVISDIDGRPIVLDFKKINTARTTDAAATVEFKVESTGEIQAGNLTLALGGKNGVDDNGLTKVTITSLKDLKTTMEPRIGLDVKEAQIDANTQAGTIHTGRINGTLTKDQWAGKDPAVYEGFTQLTVTLDGQN